MDSRLSRAEWIVATVLTLVVISLHFISATSAGALWRDEAGTVALATLPSLGSVWNSLQYDSFPILWFLVVRAVGAIAGPSNDYAVRALGCAIGIGTVGAIWFYARTFRSSVPLLSLALLAMSPILLKYGDSMRAYGLGTLLILVTAALMWRFIQKPSAGRYAAVTAAAIASVHTLYFNPIVLFALCCAGVAVCARNRSWKEAGLVILIGFLAAISLIPYASIIQSANRWHRLQQIPSFTFGDFLTKLDAALRAGGIVASAAWMAAFALALILGLAAVARASRSSVSPEQRDVVLFQLVALLVSGLGIFLFLHFVSFGTSPWYYLVLMAIAGVSVDAIFGSLIHNPTGRIIRLGAVLVLAGATFLPARRAALTLEANMDIAASKVATAARSGDVILVDPWATGVSFSRYYRGPVDWQTIPPLSFHRFHRYDLVMRQMKEPDQLAPVRPVIDGVGNALRTGHRVYVVGVLQMPAGGRSPIVLAPAPQRGETWPTGAYERQWSSMVGYFLHRHAVTFKEIRIYPPSVYNIHEQVRLFAAEGWRP